MLTEKPKILAIDDDKIWLEQVPIILEDHGEITTATEDRAHADPNLIVFRANNEG